MERCGQGQRDGMKRDRKPTQLEISHSKRNVKIGTLNIGLVSITLPVLTFAGNRLALAQGTAFTYEGRLQDGANPANGSYDLRFAIYDALTDGNVVADALTNSATGV